MRSYLHWRRCLVAATTVVAALFAQTTPALADNVPASGYRQLANGNGKCLAVLGGVASDGAKLVQWKCNAYVDSPDQYWQLQQLSNGNYRIVNHASHYCVDIVDGSTAMGAKAQLWSCNLNPQQQWRAVFVDSWIALEGANTGYVQALSVNGNNGDQGPDVLQWPVGNPTSDQRWSLYGDTIYL